MGLGDGEQHLDQRHDGKTQTFPSAAKFNPGNVKRDEPLMVRERLERIYDGGRMAEGWKGEG